MQNYAGCITAMDEQNKIDLAKPTVFKRMQKELLKFIDSCRASFEGGEYGKVSFNKLNQKWIDPFKNKKNN